MRRRGSAGVVLTLVVAATAGGCSIWGDDDPADRCASPQEYQVAQEAPTVAVPAGLDKPDASARLVIPAEPRPDEPLERTAGCLERPPDFFDKPLSVPPAN